MRRAGDDGCGLAAALDTMRRAAPSLSLSMFYHLAAGVSAISSSRGALSCQLIGTLLSKMGSQKFITKS